MYGAFDLTLLKTAAASGLWIISAVDLFYTAVIVLYYAGTGYKVSAFQPYFITREKA